MTATRHPRTAPTRPLRQPRLLVVGCGDVGRRVVRLLRTRMRMVALTSSAEKKAELQALGLRVLVGSLDAPQSLRRLAGLAQWVVHAAPPARTDANADGANAGGVNAGGVNAGGGKGVQAGVQAHRTRHLLNALARGGRSRHSGSRQRSMARTVRLVYVSTTGVYGNRDGGWVDESSVPTATTDRALRRLRAERSLRAYGLRDGLRDGVHGRFFSSSILRAPGIYAADRAHGTPRARLEQGALVLRAEDDVFTSRIHADDLARACVLAVFRGRAQRVYNVCDGVPIKAGDFLTQAAELYGLPAPERVSREEMAQRVSPMRMSFLNESRRIRNRRLQELGLQLHYPHPLDEIKSLVRCRMETDQAAEQHGTASGLL